jgi:CspA family cold shock protein
MAERGKVKWYNMNKGFGFITRDNGEGEVFLHHSAVQGDSRMAPVELREGQAVEYDVVPGPKGPSAQNVVAVDGPWG